MSTYQMASKVWSFCDTLRDNGAGYGDNLATCQKKYLQSALENLSEIIAQLKK